MKIRTVNVMLSESVTTNKCQEKFQANYDTKKPPYDKSYTLKLNY